MSAYALSRRPLVLVLILLFVLPALVAADTSTEEDLELRISNLQMPEKGYLSTGDSISFDVQIHNSGSSKVSVNTNPSCPAAFSIVVDDIMFYDSYAEDGCRDQSQGFEINAGESVTLSTMTWFVVESPRSGDIELRVLAPSSGLSTNLTLNVQKEVEVPASLKMELIVAQTPSGDSVNDEVEDVEALVRLVNIGSAPLILWDDDACMLRLTIPGQLDELTDIACDGGHGIIAPYAILDLGWLSLDEIFDDGGHEIMIALPAQNTLFANASFQYVSNGVQTVENLSASIQVNSEEMYGSGDQLSITASLENSGGQPLELDFPTTCRAEVHILDQQGVVVYDTRDLRICPDLNVNHEIAVGSSLQIEHSPWNFYDRDGCEVETGTYRLVVDVPQFAVRGYTEIEFVSFGESIDCGDSDVLPLLVNDIMEFNETGFDFSVSLGGAGVGELRWAHPCQLKIELYEGESMWPVLSYVQACGEMTSGLRQRLQANQSLFFDGLSMIMKAQDQSLLADGQYRLQVSTNSWPSSTAERVFDWPIVSEESSDSTLEEEESGVVEEAMVGTIVQGQWQYVTTDIGGCWLFIDSLERQSVLFDSTAVGVQWQPTSGSAGNYSIVISTMSHPSCEQYPTTFVLLEIVDEYTLPEETKSSSEAPVSGEADIIAEYGAEVLTGVAAVSISALLIAFIVSHEGLRIPLTGLGLSLLGLIGRTHETNDGKFQRGRLMGYLTANPGCHFRALLGALHMSNGQLTHHIKVLEDEERIWRRRDGRLVRFYPSTISSITPDSELPIPPLSPDPNSLQGKILELLDADGQMGEYPTQSELSIRLEKSQQLISHHLRTLQKFGLVEKKKFGVRNRYKLTREALFLLESSDL